MACATLDLIPAAQQRHESLTVFPLVTEGEVELPYLLLADAVAGGGRLPHRVAPRRHRVVLSFPRGGTGLSAEAAPMYS